MNKISLVFSAFSSLLLLFVVFTACSKDEFYAVIINEEFNSAASPIKVRESGGAYTVLQTNSMLSTRSNKYEASDIEIFDDYESATIASRLLEIVRGFTLFIEQPKPLHAEKSLSSKTTGFVEENTLVDVLRPMSFNDGFAWIRVRDPIEDNRGWILVTDSMFITNLFDVNNRFTIKSFYQDAILKVNWSDDMGNTILFSKLVQGNYYIESLIDSVQYYVSVKELFPIDTRKVYIPSIDTELEWSINGNFVFWTDSAAKRMFRPNFIE